MTEITLVTAYFNINRKDWKGFERTDNDYLSYFRHWVRMRNKLIVYTTPDMAKEVMRVRKEYGLAEKPLLSLLKMSPPVYQIFINP